MIVVAALTIVILAVRTTVAGAVNFMRACGRTRGITGTKNDGA